MSSHSTCLPAEVRRGARRTKPASSDRLRRARWRAAVLPRPAPCLALLLLTSLAAFCTGCLQEDERVTLNPDGSGKFSYEVTYDPQALERMAQGVGRDPEALRAALPDLEAVLFAVINGAQGVDVWSDAGINTDSTGRPRIHVAGYFKDVAEFELGNPMDAMQTAKDAPDSPLDLGHMHMEPGTGDTRVLSFSLWESDSTDSIPTRGGPLPELTAEERARLDRARTVFVVNMGMMANLFRDAGSNFEIRLPGTVVDTGFFELVGDDVARMDFDVPKIALAMSEMVQDDRIARVMLAKEAGLPDSGSSLASAMADSTSLDRFLRAVFGRPGLPRIVFRPGKPVFDYAAERNRASAHPPRELAATLARAQRATASEQEGTEVVRPTHNFRLTIPPGWTTYEAAALNPRACLGFRRGFDVAGAVVVETLQVAVDLNGLEQAMRSHVNAGGEVKHQEAERVSIAGLDFAHLTTRVVLRAGVDLYSEHWIASRNGFSWGLTIWGNVSDSAAVHAASIDVARSFRIVDTTLAVGFAEGARDVDRPEWGFALAGAADGWQAAMDQCAGLDLCELFWVRPLEAITILPVRYAGAPIDVQAAARGLMRPIGFQFPASGGFQQRPWSPPVGEGIEVLTERTIEGTTYRYVLHVAATNDAAWMLAGWYVKGRGDEKRVRRALDAVVLRAPRGPDPDPPARTAAMADFYNDAGLSWFLRKSYANAERCFRTAFDRSGTEPLYLNNVAEAMRSAGRSEEALAYLEQHRGAFPASSDIWLMRGELQREGGAADSANASFLEALRSGLDDEDELLEWLRAMVEVERPDLAITAAGAWVERHPSLRARRWHAEVLSEGGEAARADTLLEALSSEYPDDPGVAVDRARTLNEADRPAEAAEVAQGFMDRHGERADLLEALGWSQMARKWYREAKATFEKAAKLAPGDEDIAQAIHQASNMLGQGSNSGIKRPIEPVPLPRALERAMGDAPAPSGEGYPSVILRQVTGHFVEPGKPVRTTHRSRVRVVNAEGVASYSTMEFEFHPDAERAYINRIEVRDAAGDVVSTGGSDDAYVIDSPDEAASNTKLLHVQVRGVAPGCVVQSEVTFEALDPKEGLEFTRHLLGSPIPTGVIAAYVVGDTSAVDARVRNGADVSIVRGDRFVAWIVRPAHPEKWEPLVPMVENFLPMVSVCGREGTWQEVGLRYLKDIGDLLEPDAEVTRLAATLTDSMADPRRQIAVIARYVQKELHYKAIEFGRRARRPDAPDKVLAQRFGDCKDHALLLHLLLTAANVPSRLALVNTHWRIEPGLPSLDQFDHVVVLVPGLGDGWLVDATEKYEPLEAIRSSVLTHTHALILDPAEPTLLAPRETLPPDSYALSVHRTAVARDRDWEVIDSLTMGGHMASGFRKWLVGVDPKEQMQRFQGFLNDNGTVQVTDLRLTGLDDVASDVTAEIRYTVRGALTRSGTRTSASAPVPLERKYLVFPFVQDRQTPFENRWPLHLTSDVTLRLGTGAVGDLVGAPRHAEGPFCAWTLEASAPAVGDLHLHLDFRAVTGVHPPGAYDAMREDWQAALQSMSQRLEW